MYWKCWLSAILVLQILTSMDVTVCVIQYYTDQWVERTLLTWDNKQLPNQIWDSEWEVFVLSDECVCIFVCFSFHLYHRKNTKIAYTEIIIQQFPKCPLAKSNTPHNADLLNVSTWMSANKLTLNNNKTEFMVIGSNRRLGQIEQEPSICVGGVEIKKVNLAKSLGLMIDDTLSWSAQIDKITKKVNSGL